MFVAATAGYILLGINLEERDLVQLFGDKYLRYRAEVGMLLPRLGRKTTETSTADTIRRYDLQFP